VLYLWGTRTAEWFCFGDQVPNFWRLGCVKIESQIFRFLMVTLRKITTDLGKQCEMTCTRFSLENDLRMVDVAFGSTFTKFYGYLQCGAPKIAKLVYNSNNYGLWYL